MNHIERRDRQMLYIADDSVGEEMKKCRKILQKLNSCDISDFDEIGRISKELFPNAVNPFVNPTFYCDYGTHVYCKGSFFMNYNCVILDVAKVVIGDCFQAGPNVSIYTASHPMHPAARNTMYELGLEVVIGDNVWIGANSVILPGVTIGSNTVIGAGSVVNRDIPDWSVAAGNPCRVIRPITEADRLLYFRGQVIDDEARQDILKMQSDETDSVKYPSAG